DLLDEQAKNLGYANPNELMVIIDRE
ncbi:MAG TPA: septum formation initiator family protein, partial [Wolbachia sp.]|nr:septum formation initiator family protein [Wolbachia sp.]